MKEAREVTRGEAGAAMLRALMVGPVRALDLIKRVPEEFGRRGWPRDDDSFAVVACAIGAMKIGAGEQRFRLPFALLQDDRWRGLDDEGRPTALAIVDGMDLQRLLEPG